MNPAALSKFCALPFPATSASNACFTHQTNGSIGIYIRLASDSAPALAAPWLLRLRFGLIAGLVFLILLVAVGARVSLPLDWLAVPIAAMLLSNLLLPRLIAGIGGRRALGATLLLDVLALTAILSLTGGPTNPLTLLYLVQITLSAVVLSRAWTWSLGIVSILGFGILFPFHISLLALEGHHPALGFAVHLYGMWIAFVAAALLITFFIGEVSEALRRHERQSLELQIKLARLPYSYTGVWRELVRTTEAAKIGHLGTHSFRHFHRSWLDAVGTSVAVQQKMMRQAMNVAATLAGTE
jgi:hypothetical protein